jgi:hypothetical protein
MAEERRYTDAEGGFDVLVPEGWYAEPDPEAGGVEMAHPDGAGLLNLVGFPQPDNDFPDPAEELVEDDVEDLSLEGGAEVAVCEYLTEDEEEGAGETFWLVGVATAPGALVFANYSCVAGEQEEERETVMAVLRSLRLRAVDA